MDKARVIIITIQLALSILVGFLLVSFVMMSVSPVQWGAIARLSFLVVSAACMVGLIKLNKYE